MRQHIAVRFRAGDRRTYTYANDGVPVKVGDWVKAPDKSGDGWNRVEVVEVVKGVPAFPCKAILGLADGAAIDAKLLAAVPVEPDKSAPDLFGRA